MLVFAPGQSISRAVPLVSITPLGRQIGCHPTSMLVARGMACSASACMTQTPLPTPGRYSRKAEVIAWAVYDWANSAYSTLSITILVAYIQKVVLPGKAGPVAWAWGISASMLIAAILSPPLGAMADANASKRSWLGGTALVGATTAVLIGVVPSNWTWTILSLFFVTALMFELSIGFYNGFLPEIADDETMGRVSAWGFTLGYLGGALALIGAVVVIQFGARFGLPDVASQLRVGILIMGLWWGLFTIPTLVVLRDRQQPSHVELSLAHAARRAVGEVTHTLRNVQAYRMAALFLVGFLFYNDGIQTVISQSSTFALKELQFTTNDLIGLILMIQLVAMPGAMIVGWVADRLLGQKPTLMLCLAVWVGLLIAAFFVHTKGQFWALGAVLALVMGGTQSVSRAIMGLMTPPDHTAEFFGFFNLSGKATSFLGTFLFGLIQWQTGSPRLAIVSLLVFFLIGWIITARVDVERGRQQAIRH